MLFLLSCHRDNFPNSVAALKGVIISSTKVTTTSSYFPIALPWAQDPVEFYTREDARKV